MNVQTPLRQYLVPALAFLFLCGSLPPIAEAQLSPDPLEMFRRMRPTPGAFVPEFIESAKQMLQWKIDRGTMHRIQLESKIEHLAARIDDHSREMDRAKQAKLAESAFANDAIREQLLVRVLERLMESRVDIAANEALQKHLEEKLQKVAPNEIELQQFKLQRDAIRMQLEIVHEQADHLNALRKKNLIPENEVLATRIKMRTLEAELAQLDLVEKASERRKAAELASPLTDIRLELHQLKAREKISKLQLAELGTAAEVARELRRYQREIDQLTMRMEVQMKRLEEVSMELEEAELFLKQIVNASRAPSPPKESAPAKESKPAKESAPAKESKPATDR